MTVSSPDVARPSARARRLRAARSASGPVRRCPGRADRASAFTRGTPPIVVRTPKTSERLAPRLLTTRRHPR
jgi:hypothetical protein